MSHLDHIVAEVQAKGSYSEPWVVLHNAYFRGDDGFAEARKWAAMHGMTISLDSAPGSGWVRFHLLPKAT